MAVDESFITQFEVYTGKATQDSSFTLGENVMLHLTESYMQSHRLIVFDNFFTSYNLMKSLNERGLFEVGTLRTNRMGLPGMIKKQDKLQWGQFMFKTKGCVPAIKWRDNKTVTILSIYHSPKDVTFVNRKNRDGTSSEVFCPKAVS
ncbi:uncharacterized protein LOC126176448 [Schistocerca cancellata]|uniref:uncharacterized protein LOC126176448 n=1 Tax=Schistocerca cancellata TaxID=274614 RepID=UPI0021190D57|nr:uncharacterized protein LOC126176448 [Schistocerca cancellata]